MQNLAPQTEFWTGNRALSMVGLELNQVAQRSVDAPDFITEANRLEVLRLERNA